MSQVRSHDLWENSLLGRFLTFLFHTWDHSLLYGGLAAAGRSFGRVFAGSLLGKAFYSDWPSRAEIQESLAGRVVARISSGVAAVGRRMAPFLRAIWETSRVGRMGRAAAGWLQPHLDTSLLYQTLTGYSADMPLAAGEMGKSPTSPLVYLLGMVLGLVPLIPSEMKGILSPTVLMVVGTWGVALLWLCRKVMLDDYRWRGSSAFVPLAILLVIAAVSTVQSVFRSGSLLSFILWLTAILLFVMIVNLVRNSRDAAALLGPILVGGTLMGLWAMYQVVRPPQVTESWVDVTTSGELVRVFASMGNPNYLAEYMALYLPIGVALWLQHKGRRLELAIPIGLMAAALLLSWSRGGWLAFVVAMVVFVLMRMPHWSVLMFLGGLSVPLVAPESIMRRLVSAFTLADSSNMYRVSVWAGIQAMLKKFWFIGAGLGAEAFAKVYEEFMLPGAHVVHAHNTYMEVFAEMGILGLIAVLWSIFAVIRRSYVVGVQQRSSLIIAAVPAALLGLMFHGLVEHIWYNPKLLFAFWAVAGLGVGLAMGEREEGRA